MIYEVQSPNSYVVEYADGSRRILHANHLRKFHTRAQSLTYNNVNDIWCKFLRYHQWWWWWFWRNSFISAVDWDISSKFGKQIHFHLLKQMPSQTTYHKVDFRLYGRHLEKSIWRHNSAADRPITTKFSRQIQNDMLMHWSKSKPEIEFQYGGLTFSKTGSSFISAVDWDIASKFGMQIHFHLLNQIPSQTTYRK